MEVVFLVINFILAFVVIFCVGILSVYHLYCMSRNQSSVESWERSKVKTLIRRGKIMPVSTNTTHLWCEMNSTLCILGSLSIWCWLVPQYLFSARKQSIVMALATKSNKRWFDISCTTWHRPSPSLLLATTRSRRSTSVHIFKPLQTKAATWNDA